MDKGKFLGVAQEMSIHDLNHWNIGVQCLEIDFLPILFLRIVLSRMNMGSEILNHQNVVVGF
jgi:hypothetical protein